MREDNAESRGSSPEVKLEVPRYDFTKIYQRNSPGMHNVKELCRRFVLSEEFRMGWQATVGTGNMES